MATETLIDTGDKTPDQHEFINLLTNERSSQVYIQQPPTTTASTTNTQRNNSLLNNINNSNNSIVNLSNTSTPAAAITIAATNDNIKRQQYSERIQVGKITKPQRKTLLDSDQLNTADIADTELTNFTVAATTTTTTLNKFHSNNNGLLERLTEEEEEEGEEQGHEGEESDYYDEDDASDQDRLISSSNVDEGFHSGSSKYRGNNRLLSINDSDIVEQSKSNKSSSNYKNFSRRLNNRRKFLNKTGRTFRGSYRYSRVQITMAILKKCVSLLVQKSTLALFGAFLIHVTLGTIYTLSNINSYLTSYMRLHGSPNATYGGSMWISSSYAVGQGFSMVLGGYIEKRFSARLSCILGCLMHSSSTMLTSLSIDHGPLAVLVTYGFIPGFGCGLAYMTPMSNGFGWFPNRKGLVAGVILAGFGIGTFVFNMAQTAYVNPDNLSPPGDANGYFTQHSILDRVPHLFVFIGTIYAIMQFIGCCLLFKPPYSALGSSSKSISDDERPILLDNEMSMREAVRSREFVILFLVYGITTQGVLFVNSMLKEYGQLFITSDMYLAWTGSMASIANSVGRLAWGLAIDRFTFTQCFTSITIIFASLMFLMPFEFILSSKLFYLLCTLGLFGSFSGWMSTYPVHLSRVFGRTNSGMIYGLIFVSQSCGGILTALGAHYLIDHYTRFVPFFCVVLLEILGLSIYHLFYPK